MSKTFRLPELGENVDTATVTSVLVKAGDSVKKNQSVIEIETEKAAVEVPCDIAGTVAEVSVGEGDEIKVGDAILIVEEGEAGTETRSRGDEKDKKVKKSKAGEAAAEAAETEIEEPADDKEPEEEDTKGEEGEPEEDEGEEKPAAKKKPVKQKTRRSVRATPSVRKLARELGVDIRDVTPDEESGRVTADDVKARARQSIDGGGTAGNEAAALPNFEKWGKVRREKMSNVRRVTAERLGESWPRVPQVTHYDKADITELERFRKQYGPAVEQAGGKLTVTAILVKVLGIGLERFPQFNASVDMAKREVVYKQFYNVGVAVDTNRGLLVPSIKNVNRKNLAEIAAELTELSEKARNRKSTLDELRGSCMTITNLGGIGGVGFSPIIYPPEVAILGVSRAQIEPVYVEGEFEARRILPLCVSYDHRIIDGADAARFLRWTCESLLHPMRLFLQ